MARPTYDPGPPFRKEFGCSQPPNVTDRLVDKSEYPHIFAAGWPYFDVSRRTNLGKNSNVDDGWLAFRRLALDRSGVLRVVADHLSPH